MHDESIKTTGAVAIAALAAAFLALSMWLTGCGAEPSPETTHTLEDRTTAPAYERKAPAQFRGISEPRPDAWEDLLRDADLLREIGFNSVTLSPPVLITARAGGQPRVILEGEAALAEGMIDDLHDQGFAVYVAPTTRMAGFSEPVDAGEITTAQLGEDAVRWARKAEAHQAELFSPLSRYNLVLGTEAANRFSAQMLVPIRTEFHGLLAAEAAADLTDPPPIGTVHDFEKLDFKGYDYLLLDIFPWGESFDQAIFQSYVADVLVRAEAVVRRDGLKGFMIGQFGSWRDDVGVDSPDGPLLGETGQAEAAEAVLAPALPRTAGLFYYGWTLPGRGARGHAVEQTLKSHFSK